MFLLHKPIAVGQLDVNDRNLFKSRMDSMNWNTFQGKNSSPGVECIFSIRLVSWEQ